MVYVTYGAYVYMGFCPFVFLFCHVYPP